jgi:hypothetical protein
MCKWRCALINDEKQAGIWEISMILPVFVPVNVSDGVVVITGTITSSKQQQKACRQTATQQDGEGRSFGFWRKAPTGLIRRRDIGGCYLTKG